MQRIGLGNDTHRLIKGRPLIIGGIHIPFKKGSLAHSDGDVLLHALIDALLGALALGDIGELFPNTDSNLKDISSVNLLNKVLSLPALKNSVINNVDCIIELQEPKLSPYKEAIKKNLAALLNLPLTAVSVKAKTGEKLDAVGKGKAIKALVAVQVVLLYEK
ncbi:MAG: 2-C-methyl-D-erythritol 2,4-cyclodiphosphate synthase [Spirochaetaceae bacterium]|nr:2-C-methyl-D-erythritol 2,4-cyclodiphosphate synthase [Spirochaetaceae bacterium]